MPLYLAGNDAKPTSERSPPASARDAPGETLYSDLGYILLGFAVERAAGAPLDELFRERIAALWACALCVSRDLRVVSRCRGDRALPSLRGGSRGHACIHGRHDAEVLARPGPRRQRWG
jgi:hypothetical protein